MIALTFSNPEPLWALLHRHKVATESKVTPLVALNIKGGNRTSYQSEPFSVPRCFLPLSSSSDSMEDYIVLHSGFHF
jgi:hypothetical protein